MLAQFNGQIYVYACVEGGALGPASNIQYSFNAFVADAPETSSSLLSFFSLHKFSTNSISIPQVCGNDRERVIVSRECGQQDDVWTQPVQAKTTNWNVEHCTSRLSDLSSTLKKEAKKYTKYHILEWNAVVAWNIIIIPIFESSSHRFSASRCRKYLPYNNINTHIADTQYQS